MFRGGVLTDSTYNRFMYDNDCCLCTGHTWECWWTEGYDVCTKCEGEKVCRHKSDMLARRQGWFNEEASHDYPNH